VLSAGLFTGGVVLSIIPNDYSLYILTKAYLPAILFYQWYIVLTVIDSEENAQKNMPLIIINVMIVFLYFLYFLVN